MRLPAPWRLPVLAVGALLAFLAVTDPAGAAFVGGTVLAVLGLDTAVQLLRRRRRSRDRTPMSGTWSAVVEDGYALADLMPGQALAGERITLSVSPSRLLLAGRRRAPLSVAWADVADVHVLPPVHERGGRPRVLALTPVVLVLRGPHADELDLPLDDDDAEGLTPEERAADDAETLGDARARFGPDWVPGTRPLTLLVDGADGLAPLLARYRGGPR